MTTNFLASKLKVNKLPEPFFSTFWEFVRDDLSIKDFEKFIYNSSSLSEIFDVEAYDFLLMLDYTSTEELLLLKYELFSLLSNLPLLCLCSTMFNKTMLAYDCEGPYEMIDTQLNFLITKKNIKTFSAIPPIHKTRWYHEAELCICNQCGTNWFKIFEESFCDYYLVRLDSSQFNLILADPEWPNDQWPKCISNWDTFLFTQFTHWNEKYIPREHLIYQNDISMKYFELSCNKYTRIQVLYSER